MILKNSMNNINPLHIPTLQQTAEISRNKVQKVVNESAKSEKIDDFTKKYFTDLARDIAILVTKDYSCYKLVNQNGTKYTVTMIDVNGIPGKVIHTDTIWEIGSVPIPFRDLFTPNCIIEKGFKVSV
jgi:hypothetical protein